MGFVVQTDMPQKLRFLLFGLANSGKTTSLSTFPGPQQIVVCPGEKGVMSLPQREDITNYVYQVDVDEKKSSTAIVHEFESLVYELASSATAHTLSIEGLHKLYEYYLDIVTSGAYFDGKEFDSKLYGPAHRNFAGFINRLFLSPVPVIVYTAWAEKEPEGEGLTREQRRVAPKYYYPKLPGYMAKHILGEVDAVIYCCLQVQCSMGKCSQRDNHTEHFVWQLTPVGEVHGCGTKLPRTSLQEKGGRLRTLPTYIHPDYHIYLEAVRNITTS